MDFESGIEQWQAIWIAPDSLYKKKPLLVLVKLRPYYVKGSADLECLDEKERLCSKLSCTESREKEFELDIGPRTHIRSVPRTATQKRKLNRKGIG